MFAMLSPMTLAVVGIVAILLFGNRLPQVMKSLGQGMFEFKKGIDAIGDPIKDIKENKK